MEAAENQDSTSNISRDDVIRAYRRYSPVYNMLFGASLGPGRRALARAVRKLRPARVLEVGVGTGLTLAGYPARSALTGIDLSPDMLAVARTQAARLRGRRIRLELMDAERMSFGDGAFDCVTIPYVLSVTPHPDRLIAEIRRVCRRGGSILLLNHFAGSPGWRWIERALQPLSARIGFRSDFDLERQVLRHDWKVRAITPVNLLGLSRLIELEN